MRASPALRARLVAVGVGLAVVVGIVARFLTTSALWLDEALSVNIASLPVSDIPEALRHDGHPPLYYWLLHGWMELFGHGDLAVRSLSGVIGVATLVLAWAAGHAVGGRRVAALALVLMSLSPYAVRYATEARMYALVMLLVLGGFLAVVHALRGGGWPWLVALGVTAGLLPWTHYWGLYAVASTGALLLWRWWRHPEERGRTGRAIVAMAVGLLPFVLWLPSLLEQSAHTGTPWAKPARPTTVLADTFDAMGGGGFAEARLYGVVLAVAMVIGVFALQGDDGRLVLTGHVVRPLRRLVIGIVATLALGSAIGLATGAAFAPRYAAVVVPLILLVAAVGLSRTGADGLVCGLAIALLALSLASIGHNIRYQRTQVDELAEVIAAEAGPDDVVVVCPDQLGPSLERALDDEGLPPPVPYPTADDPRFVDWRDYADRNAAADPVAFADAVLRDAGDAPIWLVWSGTYRTFEGQCEALADRLGAARAGTTRAGPDTGAFEPALLYHYG